MATLTQKEVKAVFQQLCGSKPASETKNKKMLQVKFDKVNGAALKDMEVIADRFKFEYTSGKNTFTVMLPATWSGHDVPF